MFLALIFWLGGGALYLWRISLIFLRYTFIGATPIPSFRKTNDRT